MSPLWIWAACRRERESADMSAHSKFPTRLEFVASLRNEQGDIAEFQFNSSKP